jgi:CheY-like chemotaxis protein
VIRDRADLQKWYRQAMLRRIEELRDLRPRLEEGDESGCNKARGIGQALRGSGATFGFPHVTEVAALVETSSDEEALRRVEGLIAELGVLTATERDGAPIGPEWLSRAAGLPDGADVAGSADLAAAWGAVGRRAGIDASELADRVAAYFSLAVADPSSRSRAALRLVPEALAVRARIVPLREDSDTITVATACPIALDTEIELRRLTGRRPVYCVVPPEAIDAVLAEIFDRVTADDQRPRGVPSTAGSGAGAEDRVAHVDAHEEPTGLDEGPGRVLVVDDDAGARLLARSLLEKRGYAVDEAVDGVEALEVVRAEGGARIELVVADLNMPKMDGLELIWELRDLEAQGPLAVIVVTGEVDEVLETQLMEEGADDYIRKPIDPRLFLARVEATIRRTRESWRHVRSDREDG